MTNSTNGSDVRYMYLRSIDSDRVVTVARRLTADKSAVEFSVAINRPHRQYNDGDTEVHVNGDNFVKAVGRKIASGRLASNKEGLVFRVPLATPATKPIEAILTAMANGIVPVRAVKQVATDNILLNAMNLMADRLNASLTEMVGSDHPPVTVQNVLT